VSQPKLKMTRKYKPISCSFVDEIEIAATQGKKGVVEYMEGGVVNSAEMTVVNWQTENSEEFLISKEGHKIRLDNIVNFLGTPWPGDAQSC